MAKNSQIANFIGFKPREVKQLVEIKDLAALTDKLNAMVNEKLTNDAPQAGSRRLRSPHLLETYFSSRAKALRSPTEWVADKGALERGLAAMQQDLDKETNLSVSDFCRLSNKSEQAVYRAITRRTLLALECGKPGKRVPDWQLFPQPLKLTREVLKRAPEVDPWTLYVVLSEPLEILDDRTPVEAVRQGQQQKVADIVLNELGVHE